MQAQEAVNGSHSAELSRRFREDHSPPPGSSWLAGGCDEGFQVVIIQEEAHRPDVAFYCAAGRATLAHFA